MAEQEQLSSDGGESDWDEVGEAGPPCLCLFCSTEFEDGPFAMVDHCAQQHGFKFFEVVERLGMCVVVLPAILMQCVCK